MNTGRRLLSSRGMHRLHATAIPVGLALIAVYVICGSTYLAVRIALASFPPLLLSSFRFLPAGGLLYLVLRVRGIPTPRPRQWVWATLIGGFLFGVCQGGVAFAQQWVSSGFAAIGIATIPLWTTLFLGIWRRWPRRQEWLGLAIGFAGVLLLNVDGAFHASPPGAALVLVAATSWALGSAWKSHLSLPAGLMTNSAEMLAGGTILLFFHLLVERQQPGPIALSSVGAVVYLAVFGGIIVYSAYVFLLRHVSFPLATSYAYVNPLVAVGLGLGMGGERPSLTELLVLVVILVGAGCILLKPRVSAPR
jgi:drug/metabolite transporter (DMT)-like permease